MSTVNQTNPNPNPAKVSATPANPKISTISELTQDQIQQITHGEPYKAFKRILVDVMCDSDIMDPTIADELIAGLVAKLYAQHKGEPEWDLAYVLWCALN